MALATISQGLNSLHYAQIISLVCFFSLKTVQNCSVLYATNENLYASLWPNLQLKFWSVEFKHSVKCITPKNHPSPARPMGWQQVYYC